MHEVSFGICGKLQNHPTTSSVAATVAAREATGIPQINPDISRKDMSGIP